MSNLTKLIELKTRILKDKNLPLRTTATNLVFGEGNPNSKIIISLERFAMEKFLPDEKITKVHGKINKFVAYQ